VLNSLPYDLRSTDIALDTFKNELKTFLFDADTQRICCICEFGLYRCHHHHHYFHYYINVIIIYGRWFGTLFHWTVELLLPLTHLRSVLRHFSLIRRNRTVARASVLWRDINWLIDWLIDWLFDWSIVTRESRILTMISGKVPYLMIPTRTALEPTGSCSTTPTSMSRRADQAIHGSGLPQIATVLSTMKTRFARAKSHSLATAMRYA